MAVIASKPHTCLILQKLPPLLLMYKGVFIGFKGKPSMVGIKTLGIDPRALRGFLGAQVGQIGLKIGLNGGWRRTNPRK